MPFVTISIERLRLAGHEVTPANGVPGLWDVAGLARDVTTGQLHSLADQHCAPYVLPFKGVGISVVQSS